MRRARKAIYFLKARKDMNKFQALISIAAAALLIGCGDGGGSGSSSAATPTPTPSNGLVKGLNGVNHVVVIYLENRSYDSLFGNFPGSNGFLNNNYTFSQYQLDENGSQYPTLPMPYNNTATSNNTNTNQVLSSTTAWAYYMQNYPFPQGFNSGLANAPFSMDGYINSKYAISQNSNYGEQNNPGIWYIIPDIIHKFFPNQYQLGGAIATNAGGATINGGAIPANSLYTLINSLSGTYSSYVANGGQSWGEAMGYNNMSSSNMWTYAQNFAMLDNFYQAAFGGSFLNHQYLIAAQAPTVSALPSGTTNTLSASTGKSFAPCSDTVYTRLPCTSTSGTIYAVNTIQPLNPPFDPTTQPANRLPVQTSVTIGDNLSAKTYLGSGIRADTITLWRDMVPT